MLDIKKIRTDCPKAIDKLDDFIAISLANFQEALIKEGLVDIKDSLPTMSKEDAITYVENVIPANLRILFDFFDNQQVRIFINPSPEDENLFTYYNSVEKESKVASSRPEAEELAFTNAFYTLEKQLP